MRLVYIAQIGISDNWAHTVQIMKMCEAFAQNGLEVTLLSAKRKTEKSTDPYEMYGVEKIFKIVEVPFIDIYPGTTSKILFWVRTISFIISARFYLLFNNFDYLYTRETLLCLFFRRIFLELHVFPKKVTKIHLYIFKKVLGIITVTSFIKEKLIAAGLKKESIHVAHDAVRAADFSVDISIDSARAKIGLDKDRKLFGYIGSLKTMGMEKGTDTAILALKFLPSDYYFYVVGGVEEDIEFYKNFAKEHGLTERVLFMGRVPHKDVGLHMCACDILVTPLPDKEFYRWYVSPLKIFEYMAAKRPMVISDLPTMREVLTEKEALFIPTGDSEALAYSIKKIMEDDHLYKSLVEAAYKKVISTYTWQIRARGILEYFNVKVGSIKENKFAK